MRTIRMLKGYPPLERIFSRYAEEEGAVFLDSSLRNHLGRYSVVGLYPYLTLVKGEHFTVNGKVCKEDFHTFVKEYLKRIRMRIQRNFPLSPERSGIFPMIMEGKKKG